VCTILTFYHQDKNKLLHLRLAISLQLGISIKSLNSTFHGNTINGQIYVDFTQASRLKLYRNNVAIIGLPCIDVAFSDCTEAIRAALYVHFLSFAMCFHNIKTLNTGSKLFRFVCVHCRENCKLVGSLW